MPNPKNAAKIYVIISLIAVAPPMALVSGCSREGDFGRPRRLIVDEYVSEMVVDFSKVGVSSTLDEKEDHYRTYPFSLTRPEIIVRDAAVHFGQPLTKMHTTPGKRLEPTAYAEYMTSADLTYGKARIGFLTSQIKADYIWLKRFAEAAGEVRRDDGDRALYLETKRIVLTDQDRIRTYSRIRENEQLVYSTFKDLDDRIASYVYAIERSPLEAPGTSVGEAQTALEILRKEAAMARAAYDKLARRLARRRLLIPGRWKRAAGQYDNDRGDRSSGSYRSSGRYGRSGENHTDGSDRYVQGDSGRESNRHRVRMNELKPVGSKYLKLVPLPEEGQENENRKENKTGKPVQITPKK